jgi:hypothetical protein
MTEHAFIASDLEARGLHDGTITAVIRPVKPQPIEVQKLGGADGTVWVWPPNLKKATSSRSIWLEKCPFGQPGDVLAAKETWAMLDENYRPAASGAIPVYRIDHVTGNDGPDHIRWQSGATMSRDLIRLRLTVQAVRAVRVQELAEADILALGIVPTWRHSDGRLHTYYDGWADDQARAAFAPWWDARWGKRYPHDSNPWLWLGMVRKGAE